MNRRIAVVIAVSLALVVAVVAQVTLAGRGGSAGQSMVGLRLAGPWYTPQERQALIEYASTSFAQKRAILAGAGTP